MFLGYPIIYFSLKIKHKVNQKREENIRNKIPLEMEAIDRMNGQQFEQWCAMLLKRIGYTNVKTTPGSGDQGVDIVAEKDGIRWAFQCKRYSSNLSNTPVQEVYAGMRYYQCQCGAVMTNSYFTSGGAQLARAVGVELWDRRYIASIINELEEKQNAEIKKSHIHSLKKCIEQKTKKPHLYNENGEGKMEKGLWPHQHAVEIDHGYFDFLPDIPHPDFDVVGVPRFPDTDPHNIDYRSIIVIETAPFNLKDDAELFAGYAKKHFYAKTWVEERDGKYLTVVQTHVYSIQSNYWEEEEQYHL